MKIKTKKQLNLHQLIEWAWEYGLKEITFYSINDDRGVAYEVSFDNDGSFYSNDEINPEIIFTVEFEEEITEDTVIPKIVELDLCGYDQHEDLFIQENKSINQILNENEVRSEAIYILNNDLTMTVIWTRENGLVE